MEKLLLHYFKEINNNVCSEEDLEYMAKKFVEDYRRYLSAREDFQEAM